MSLKKPVVVSAPGQLQQLQAADSLDVKLDDLVTPDDNTDLNATTGRHGLLLKLAGGTTTFLRADGAWADPSGSPGGGEFPATRLYKFQQFG